MQNNLKPTLSFEMQKELFEILVAALVCEMERFGHMTQSLADEINLLLEKKDFQSIYMLPSVRSFFRTQCAQYKDYPGNLLKKYV